MAFGHIRDPSAPGIVLVKCVRNICIERNTRFLPSLGYYEHVTNLLQTCYEHVMNICIGGDGSYVLVVTNGAQLFSRVVMTPKYYV